MAKCNWMAVAALSAASISTAAAQQTTGFALERFYPSAPGAGWFVMDDLNFGEGLGGAIAATSGYAHNPLSTISSEAIVDIGAVITYKRFRFSLNLPLPVVVNGASGAAPTVNLSSNPDTFADTSVGFDVRLLGKPNGRLRIGAGAQLIFPSGNRADYVTDARYRGMFRLLAAGDTGHFTYAGQVGVDLRSLVDQPEIGGPNGNEFLYGVSFGRKFAVQPGWAFVVGPEIFGQTAVRSGENGNEGLMTMRYEGTGSGRNLRFKVGIGHAFEQRFGTPEWRVLAGVELFGQH